MNAQRWPVRAWLKRGVPYGSVVLAGVVLGFVALAQSSPEINVERPASFTIVDGGTDAQGNRPVGVQQTLTYTVRNAGTATLNVTLVASASASNVTVDAITPTSFTVSSGGGTATFDVRYTPTAEGSFSFELDLANDDADEGNYDITVSGDALNHPTIDKAFSPTTIGVGGISTLTFTLTNLNAGSGLTGLNFTDALPAGVEIATTPNLGGTCGAVATNFTPNIAAGGTSINLTSGVSLAASGSCTIFVDVN